MLYDYLAVKQQQRDLDKGINMDMQLNPEQQIQSSRPSRIYDVEGWTEEKLRVENADIGLNLSARGSPAAAAPPARWWSSTR